MSSALYIHIPFCEKRCGYCDFYTVADRQQQIPDYLDALKREISVYAQQDAIRKLTFSTIFLGGGTPSLLSAEQISEIISKVREQFDFDQRVEVTVETNPGTVNLQKLQELRAAGVNRLSIGIQSFNKRDLTFLERIHSGPDAEACVVNAREAGFENISVDLIFGIPNQTISDWRDNLEHAVSLKPYHISAYNLTYEAGTPLTIRLETNQFIPTPEPAQRNMHLLAIEYLAQKGYQHYEISNYCLPGYESQHNSKYWDGSAYLGLGASAHSYIEGKRFWNVSNYALYVEKLASDHLPIEDEELLDKEQISIEAIWLGMRKRQGLNLRHYEEVTGESFIQKHSTKLVRFFPDTAVLDSTALTNGKASLHSRLLNIENGHLMLTDEGVVLCDAVCAEFV